LPPLAPALAAVGLAPLYAAIAGAAGSTARRAGALALLGVTWLVIAGAVPLGPDPFASAGLGGAGPRPFRNLLPRGAGAVVMLGVLVWSAGVVALHGTMLPGAEPPSAAAVGALALALAALVAWRRTGAPLRLPIALQGRRAAGPLASAWTISVLRNLEARSEGIVEGVCSRAFSYQVQPVEIARKLAREMDSHKTASVSRVYVPNQYTVYLSPDDHERLEGYERSLEQELSGYLLEHA